jgi:hypothetical protein
MSVAEAVNMVQSYQDRREMLSTAIQGGPNSLPVHETFNLQAIHDLICQPTAIGFRIYPALDNENNMRFVLVGVDSDGEDIVSRTKNNPGGVYLSEEFSNMVEESGQRWP